MKICFIANPKIMFLEGMIRYFINRGHEIHIIPVKMPEQNIEYVKYHYLGEISETSKVLQFIKYLKVRKYIHNFIKPDILSAFSIWHSGWIGAFSRFHPFILHILGSDIFIAPNKSIIRKYLTRDSIKKADVIISESEHIKSISSKIKGSFDNNYVIQFGIDLNLFKPNLDTSNLKKKLKINNNGYVIFSPRNSKKIYNQDIVLKAFSLVYNIRKDVYLLIKTQNKEYRLLFERLSKKYGISDRVRYFEFVPKDDLPYYYNISDIFLSVPSSDSVPVTLQEAMACGIPPIVTNLQPLREWIIDDFNGCIVPIRDAEKLSKKILYLLYNDRKRKEIARININKVGKLSNYYINMAMMENVYLNSMNYINEKH